MTNKYYNSLKQVWVSSDKDDETENENFEPEIRGKLKSALQMPNIMVFISYMFITCNIVA